MFLRLWHEISALETQLLPTGDLLLPTAQLLLLRSAVAHAGP